MENRFLFNFEEISQMSNISSDEWQKISSKAVDAPPYNLENRLKALKEAYDVLTSCGAKFWLTGGSLLGAVRDDDFIHWDDDIDMDMLEEDFTPLMYKLKENLIASGFIVRLSDVKKFPKISFFKYGQKIALGALYKQGRWRTRPIYKYPASCFLQEEYIDFKGMRFRIPSPVDKFLSHVYGNWREVIKSDIDEEYYSPRHFKKNIFTDYKAVIKKLANCILRRNKKHPIRLLKFYTDTELNDRRKDLLDIKEVLDTLGIRFLLIDGILLGAIREKGFIKWDWDVELGLYAEEVYKRLPLILQALYEKGFEIININREFKNLKVNVIKRGTKFSLNGFYPDGKWRRHGITRFPGRFFSNAQEIEFLGETYLSVSSPKEYLEYQYGDWQTPRQDTDSNKYLENRIYDSGMSFKNRLENIFNNIRSYIRSGHYLFRREAIFSFMLQQAVKQGSTFIDIGSNDGCETVAVLKATKGQVDVFLVEPDKSNLSNAKNNIEKREKTHASRVQYLNYGISHRSGKGDFFISKHAANLNSAILGKKANDKIEVDFITLDDLMQKKGIRSPLVLKMDIEGYEVEALRGALETLKTMPDVKILIELHPFAYNKERSLRRVLECLFKWNFRVRFLESAGLPLPFKFHEKGLKPVKIVGTRGLYVDVAEDIVLDLACSQQMDVTNHPPYFTRKIVRSILLEKSNNEN